MAVTTCVGIHQDDVNDIKKKIKIKNKKNQHHSQSHRQFLSVNVNCTQLQVQHTPQPEAALVTYYLTSYFFQPNASH